jgi:hypothetical protein
MKYYDKNGNIHNSIIKAYWNDFKIDCNTINTDRVDCIKIKFHSGDSVKVDYINNKLYVYNQFGTRMVDSDINPASYPIYVPEEFKKHLDIEVKKSNRGLYLVTDLIVEFLTGVSLLILTIVNLRSTKN